MDPDFNNLSRLQYQFIQIGAPVKGCGECICNIPVSSQMLTRLASLEWFLVHLVTWILAEFLMAWDLLVMVVIQST